MNETIITGSQVVEEIDTFTNIKILLKNIFKAESHETLNTKVYNAYNSMRSSTSHTFTIPSGTGFKQAGIAVKKISKPNRFLGSILGVNASGSR